MLTELAGRYGIGKATLYRAIARVNAKSEIVTAVALPRLLEDEQLPPVTA